MLLELKKSVLVFFSYAHTHKDTILRDKLSAHLSILKYRGLIDTWYDQDILAGEEWDQQLDLHLGKAHIILLLISPDFMASNYCYSIQMTRALERHERGEASVIPILLRPVWYKGAPFTKLRMLPTCKKPVTKWRDQDDAFVNIACNIEKIAQKYAQPAPTRPLKLLKYAHAFPFIGWLGCLGWIVALIFIFLFVFLFTHVNHSVLQLHSSYSLSPLNYTRIIFVIMFILAATSITIRDIQDHWRKFRKHIYYEEAISAYQQALVRNPSDADAYHGMGNALSALKRFDEALDAFQQAIKISPTSSSYAELGNVYTKLHHYDKALTAYAEALMLGPVVTFDQKSFERLLQAMGRKQ